MPHHSSGQQCDSQSFKLSCKRNFKRVIRARVIFSTCPYSIFQFPSGLKQFLPTFKCWENFLQNFVWWIRLWLNVQFQIATVSPGGLEDPSVFVGIIKLTISFKTLNNFGLIWGRDLGWKLEWGELLNNVRV